jgi:hypothetical protein
MINSIANSPKSIEEMGKILVNSETPKAPRKLESTPCTRCGGAKRIAGYSHVHGGICFKCLGAGVRLTKRGRAANDFLQRLRQRTTGELTPDMLVYYQGFNAGSFAQPSRFMRVNSVSELKETGVSHMVDGQWVKHLAHVIECDGMTSSAQLHDLHRVGQTGLGKQRTFKLALDYQDMLTKSGTIRKGASFGLGVQFTDDHVKNAEMILDRTDTREWVVGKMKTYDVPNPHGAGTVKVTIPE